MHFLKLRMTQATLAWGPGVPGVPARHVGVGLSIPLSSLSPDTKPEQPTPAWFQDGSWHYGLDVRQLGRGWYQDPVSWPILNLGT